MDSGGEKGKPLERVCPGVLSKENLEPRLSEGNEVCVVDHMFTNPSLSFLFFEKGKEGEGGGEVRVEALTSLINQV